MTPIADFEQLTRGTLAFPPERNGPNRSPDPLDTVMRGRWRYAE